MKIVLVGNPNVGKSVIFNMLTGSYVTVSNYPGTTVDISKGAGKFGGRKFAVIDTPGVNSLSARSEDEKVTRDILSKSDIGCIIQVADSKNLKRSLLLTLALLELKIPMVLNLNMKDEARARGIKVDTKKLSSLLGVEVVETVAVTGEGVGKLKEAVLEARVPDPKVLPTEKDFAGGIKPDILLLNKRNNIAGGIADDVLMISGSLKKRLSEAISNFAMRPATGMPLLLFILVVMYLFVGKLAAGSGVDFLENKVFGNIVNPYFINTVNRYVGIEIIRDFLIGDYGIITMALTYAFAIVLPIVTAFFIFFGVLEDSGYLPRLSVLSDRIFRIIGLNGRAILPVILGLGCGTMATLTARILDTKKERILVTFILALAIPCSAQLGVIMGMLGAVSARALVLWFCIIFSVLIGTGYAASKIIPGTRSSFIQEIPPIRMPQLKNIIAKTYARLLWYLKEAVPLFVLGTAILFILDRTGVLETIRHLASPIVVRVLGLPMDATDPFIIGFLRRDYGAAGLYALSRAGMLDAIQVLVSVVVITLFIPCIAQFFVTIKERGARAAFIIGGAVFTFAILVGGVLNFALRYFAARGISII